MLKLGLLVLLLSLAGGGYWLIGEIQKANRIAKAEAKRLAEAKKSRRKSGSRRYVKALGGYERYIRGGRSFLMGSPKTGF